MPLLMLRVVVEREREVRVGAFGRIGTHVCVAVRSVGVSLNK